MGIKPLTISKTLYKFLIFFLFIVAFYFIDVLTAQAATYYVSPSGSNTAPYDTWGKASTAINIIFTNYDLGSGDTIEIDGGASGITYSQAGTAVINVGINDGGVEIRGSTEVEHNGLVTIDGTVNSNHGIYIISGATNVIVRNLKVKAKGSAKYAIYARDSSSFYDMEVDGSQINSDALSIGIAGTGITVLMDRMNIYNNAGLYSIYQSGASHITLQRSKISGFTGTSTGAFIYLVGGALFTSNNNIYTNCRAGAFSNQGGSITLNNDMVVGIRSGSIFSVAGGNTITANNCLINGVGTNPASLKTGGGTITYNNCVFSNYPRFVSTKTGNTGRIVVSIDSSDYNYLSAIVQHGATYNIPISMAIAAGGAKYWWGTNTLITTKLQTLYANGANEIMNHTYSHPHLCESDAFRASYVGVSVNPRIVVAGVYPNLTISAVTDSGIDVGPLDVTNASYDEITEISTIIDSHADWSTGLGDFATLYTQSKGLKVATTTVGTNTSIPFDIDTDYSHWEAEIMDATTYMEDRLGANTVKSFAYPFGIITLPTEINAALQTWLNNNMANTHANGARTFSDSEQTISPQSTLFPESVQIMGIGTVLSQYITGSGTETEIRQNIRSFVDWVVQTGALGVFTLHEVDTSSDQVEYMLNELNSARLTYPSITFMRFGDYVDYIRANWTDAGGGVYTKTLTDQSDYRLQYNSPNIDSGTAISGLTTDILGNHIYGTPDIGGYEYQPPYTLGTDNVNTSADIRIYADGKYRYTGATSTSDIADLAITPLGGWGTGDYSQWMDVAIDTWDTTSTYYKKWTEEAVSSTISTAHTIGDLRANQYYQVKVDNFVIETLQADDSGQITFTYSGGYSTKTFEVKEIPTAPTIGTPTVLSSNSIRWNFTDNADNETGFKLYNSDGTLIKTVATPNLSYIDETGISASTIYTRYIKAYNSYGESSASAEVTQSLGSAPAIIINTLPSANQQQIQTNQHQANIPTVTFDKPISQMTKEEILAKIAEIAQAINQIKSLMPNNQSSVNLFSSIPTTFIFENSLKKGITDIAVKYLQMILNQDKDTQLTDTGLGSPGNETTYFGSLTERAVIKFQEKYRDAVLKSWGLTNGTGFVGKTTRDKLDELLSR